MVEFYLQKGPRIFADIAGARTLQHWFHRKFPKDVLRDALRDPQVFGEKTLGESVKRLVIPSYNLGEDDVYLFKTPHHERLKRDWKVPAWQVALATSAAPTYFPASRYVENVRHIDGGVWANNPIMVGVVEAVSMLSVPLESIYVLSLGTSDAVVRRPSSLDSGGKLKWANHAAQLIMRGQSLGAWKQVSHLLGDGRVSRIDPKVPDGLFALDKANTGKELIAKAAHESRIHMPEIEARFMGHKSGDYVPCHGGVPSRGAEEESNNAN